MKQFLTKFKYLLIGLGLALAGTVYAVNVTVPQSTVQGSLPVGNTNGTYSNGNITVGSGLSIDTSTPGTIHLSNTAAGGVATTTITANLKINGPDFTFATGTPPTGLDQFITSSGSTVTWTQALQAGYNIPLSASTTNWNTFYNTPSNRITAGANLSWTGNTLNDVMASSTLIAGGTATFSPSVTFATTTDTNILLNIVCGVSTCTFNPGWNGTLADGRIASAATWNSKLSTVTASSPLSGSGTGGSPLVVATGDLQTNATLSFLTGDGKQVLLGTTTKLSVSTANLTLTSSNLSFGSGDGKLVLVGTTTNITLTDNPTFTKGTFTNASTTNLSVATNLYLTNLSTGCLNISGGLVGSTGVACGSGTGSSQWTVGNGLIYNATSTDLVGIGTSNPLTTLYVQGKSGTNPFVVASSTDSTALLTVGQNGSTTISQIGTGIVQSASGGVLYTVPASTYLTSVSLTAGATISGSAFTFGTTTDTNILTQIVCATATCTFTPQWTGVLAPARGGTGTSTAPTQQGQLLAADSSNAKYGPTTLVNSATLTFATGTVAQISANVLKVPNALTFNNGGAGASSGQTFDGSAAATISYNTIGAQVAGTYLGNTNVSGTNGQVAYFTGANTVNSATKLLFDGTNFGFNATSSTVGVNIQGTQGTNNPFNVASSSGISVLAVTNLQRVTIGSSTPQATLVVEGSTTIPTLDIFRVASSTNTTLFNVAANGNIGIGTTTALGLTSIQGSSAIDLLDFYNTAGTKIGSFASSTDPMVSIGSTTPLALFTIVASSTSATTTGQFGDPSASKGFCLAWARDDGSMVYIHIPAGSTTFTIATATTTCATIFR